MIIGDNAPGGHCNAPDEVLASACEPVANEDGGVGLPVFARSKVEPQPYFRAMKKSRFSESQIIAVLARHERGEKTRELCRDLGISDATFYNWKAKYGGSARASSSASRSSRRRTPA